jgi:transposase-like protein
VVEGVVMSLGETARRMLKKVVDNFGNRAPRVASILEQGFGVRGPSVESPDWYWKRLRTTSGIERLNGQVPREKVMRIFS